MTRIASRHRIWRAALALLLALPLLIGLGWPPLGGGGAVRAATALPTHFGIGLSAELSGMELNGWLPDSGIPWDYAYQYLAAGVNTNNGWETWNENGQFPLWYAQAAHSHGYIPTFSYYEIFQSSGSCDTGCSEPQRDLSNLNNPTTMAAYYNNFKLLMQRLGPGSYNNTAGYGDTAIVHIEPDLSGYAQQATLENSKCYGFCSGTGNNPALLNASVASSGIADVAAYPNTYQGFNWALLHLRDTYAPNVRLAIHISGWATLADVDSDTRADFDATARGTLAGQFAAQSGATTVPSGVSPYDVIFNDVSDRDAGYYKYVLNRNVFWDRQNVAFPNFHRWETYLGAAITAAGSKPAYVWQIPLGNQVFKTMNNTDGHYQDNRTEYFFGHIGELAQIGIVGLMFGAGNDGSTRYTNKKADGITNPAPICTTDGTSGAQICASAASTVSDDDGGYLRMAARQYYNAPYPLSGASPSPSPSISPAPSPSTNPVPRFADVPAGYWAHDPIGTFAQRGITTGCDAGFYCPERGVTRAEMAVFLDRTLGHGSPTTPAGQRFTDVPPSYWAYTFIDQFAQLGITLGCGGSEFCPDRGVSRAEMAAFLIRALQRPQLTPATSTFADVPTSHPQYGYIEALVNAGVTTGCGDDGQGHRLYCPDRAVTRADMAVFITRAFP